MAFSPEEIRANRDYFAHKLHAEKQKTDVVKRVKGEPGTGEFLVLDVRSRDAFAKAHMRGAVSATGFFAKEMNAGWAEWTAAELPTHSGRVAAGQIRCECSR